MTTAEARTLARQAQKHLDWLAAARFWEIAINNYPKRADGRKDALGSADISHMETRRKSCLNTAKMEGMRT